MIFGTPNPVASAMRHVAESNDWGCGIVGGVKSPKRPVLGLTDEHLDEIVARFPSDSMTRARTIVDVAGDWEDHYAAMAIYLRLNNVLPPTARH
ncbi:MAG TPA: hypothetical protein VFA43_00975 [Gemmatimonadaceae bacterium]|nr:hypothetical protein [Gemmatimonadaceae bacterium]